MAGAGAGKKKRKREKVEKDEKTRGHLESKSHFFDERSAVNKRTHAHRKTKANPFVMSGGMPYGLQSMLKVSDAAGTLSYCAGPGARFARVAD